MSKSKDYQNIGSNILWIFQVGLLIIYIIYGGLRIYNNSYDSNIILYLTAIVSIAFFIYLLISTNAMLANELLCGKSKSGKAFIFMIFPFFFIFGLGNLLLNTFPGWLRGFSNTFGLYLAQLLGMNNQLSNLFFNENNTILDKIKSNPAPIINELDIKNIKIIKETNKLGKEVSTIQWPQLDKLNDILIKQEDQQDINERNNKFAYFVLIKDMVAHFIWNLLLGTITIYSTILMVLNNNDCNANTKDNNEFKKFIGNKK